LVEIRRPSISNHAAQRFSSTLGAQLQDLSDTENDTPLDEQCSAQAFQ